MGRSRSAIAGRRMRYRDRHRRGGRTGRMGLVSAWDEHVLSGFRPFGLRRWRAMCSCGYETAPVEGADEPARVAAARQLLITEHGAREPYPGEAVGVPLVGGVGGPVRPRPARP